MHNHRERGIALLTAIWILAVLLVLVGGFAAMVHGETEVARNFGQLAQARWAALAGMRRADTEIALIAEQPYTALDETNSLINSEDEDVSLGDCTYQVVITDEAGKININTAPSEELGMLFPQEVADAIIDWRDEDSTPEPQGAEDEYYAGLTPPYRCKNAPFTTVRELLLVRGVTQEMLETPVTEDGRMLEDLLTVSSWDTNTDSEGQARVNISTANKETLTAEFGEVLTEAEIDAIIRERTSSPFSSPADLLRVPNLSREKVANIYDRLTTSEEERRPGLVNINTAPLEVLAALSGMDEATAQAIVQYRETQEPFTDIGQLLMLEQVSTSVFMQVADQITTRSQTFKVVSTGQYEDGVSHSIASLVQVESAGGSASTRVLYWRE